MFDCCESLAGPTVGAQLHQRGAATVNGTSSFAIFASKLLNMPPSTRANITVDDDTPAAGAAEQGASLQMLNLDTAVSAAVERTFESHRSEMVAQLLAALETREMRASRHDAAPPAADQSSNAIGCNQLQSLQSASFDEPVGVSGANGDSSHLENSLSNAPPCAVRETFATSCSDLRRSADAGVRRVEYCAYPHFQLSYAATRQLYLR